MINYINDKQLRFLLIAPVFFKHTMAYGVEQEDIDKLAEQEREAVKQNITEINECSNFLNQFLTDIKNKYNISQNKLDKIIINHNKKFIYFLNKFYFDKQNKKFHTTKIVTTFCFAYRYLVYDICEHKNWVLSLKNDKFIIKDSNYLFFQDYARITLDKFIKPLEIMAFYTADKYEKQFKVNFDKFENKCMKNVDNYIEFFKNI